MTGTGITWRELIDFLTAQGCTFDHQVGSHIRGHTPFGAEFGTCDPNKPGYVSTRHLEEIGRVFGKNLHDTLVWMGRKPPGKAKVTVKRSTGKVPPPFEKRVTRALKHIERQAIRGSQTCTATFNRGAVMDLEKLAAQLDGCLKLMRGDRK